MPKYGHLSCCEYHRHTLKCISECSRECTPKKIKCWAELVDMGNGKVVVSMDEVIKRSTNKEEKD